jgi:rRNA maturation endonuclease Nob1
MYCSIKIFAKVSIKFCYDCLMNNLRFQLSKQRIAMFRRHHDLYCVECGYVHPGDAGLEEGDICPDCGRGILIEI